VPVAVNSILTHKTDWIFRDNVYCLLKTGFLILQADGGVGGEDKGADEEDGNRLPPGIASLSQTILRIGDQPSRDEVGRRRGAILDLDRSTQSPISLRLSVSFVYTELGCIILGTINTKYHGVRIVTLNYIWYNKVVIDPATSARVLYYIDVWRRCFRLKFGV